MIMPEDGRPVGRKTIKYRMKRKIYAKTLNPEWFDYQVYKYDVEDNDNVIIDGGREYQGLNTDDLEVIDRLYNDYDSWDWERCLKVYYDNSITKYLNDMLNFKTHSLSSGLNSQSIED